MPIIKEENGLKYIGQQDDTGNILGFAWRPRMDSSPKFECPIGATVSVNNNEYFLGSIKTNVTSTKSMEISKATKAKPSTAEPQSKSTYAGTTEGRSHESTDKSTEKDHHHFYLRINDRVWKY